MTVFGVNKMFLFAINAIYDTTVISNGDMDIYIDSIPSGEDDLGTFVCSSNDICNFYCFQDDTSRCSSFF